MARPQKGQTGRPQVVQTRVQTAQRGRGPRRKDQLEDRLRTTLRKQPQQKQGLPHRQTMQVTLELLPQSRHPERALDAAGGSAPPGIRARAGRLKEMVVDRQVHGGQDRKRPQKSVQSADRQATQKLRPPHRKTTRKDMSQQPHSRIRTARPPRTALSPLASPTKRARSEHRRR